MKTITHENEIYVLKTDMESAIKDRISKVTAKATAAETTVQELKARLEEASGKTANTEALSRTIDELKGQLATQENRFGRYKAISKYGLGSDQDLVDAIEWTYDKKMSDVSEADRPELGAWLESHLKDPSQAPSILRPHLTKIASNQNWTSEVSQAKANSNNPPQQAAPMAQPPNVNQGAINPPNQMNLIKQGIQDPDFYRANRDAIKQQFEALRAGKR
jgi:hypothetical protein